MSIMTAVGIGAVAGLVVSSWQGFKDPPWEGFFVSKFIRSILIGSAAGFFFFFADAAGVCSIDNPGVLAFAIVAVERVVGEAYKGFFRKGAHAEYFRLLRRMGIPESVYFIKLLSGIGFIIGAYWLFRLLGWWLARMVAGFGTLSLPGLVIGAVSGLLVAIGGALKDSQFEGFIPTKFIRSPIVGAITGVMIIHFSTSWFLVVLASIGGERVGVELYKTFLKRHVRGIHANQPIRHPAWLARRGIFALSFGLAVAVCLVLLFA
jgi:hypothetical protein